MNRRPRWSGDRCGIIAEMIVERQVELRFGDQSRADQTHTNLSAIRLDGRCLWAAGDETATIERLTALPADAGDGTVTAFDDHRTFRLADYVKLPAGPDEEADIEGIARDDGWLWAVGSHSLKRKKIKDGHSPAKSLKRLATVVREENRFILARLPLVTGADGLPEITGHDGDRAASILGGHGDSLTDLLAGDRHLAPFLALPGKDNGVDIEGIAVRDGRVYIGFRGPVLRGWAVVMEIRPEPHPSDPGRLRLMPLAKGGDEAGDGSGARPLYRLHFLDLGGLGIRDLCPYGDDLLILTGPSMDLDGPVRLVRWRGAAAVRAGAGAVHADDLEVLGDLPYGDGDDHAEGIAVLRPAGGHAETAEARPMGRTDETTGSAPGSLLVVYDSPAPARH